MRRTTPDRTDVILDVDNVLTDYHHRARSLILDMFGREIPPSAFTHWNATLVLDDPAERKAMMEALGKPGFASSLVPDQEAIAAVEAMRKAGADVTFATTPHPDSPSWKEERERWLVREFGAREEDVIHIRKKHLLGGDAFLDDVPENVERWCARNPRGKGRVWRRIYNASHEGAQSISSWGEFLELLEIPTEADRLKRQ